MGYPIEIRLASKNETVKVLLDKEDYDKYKDWAWHIDGKGYVRHRKYLGGGRKNAKYTNIFLHRLVNDTPGDKYTDHIDGNKLDNRKSNLRTVTNKQNTHNQKVRSTNTSGYTGVYIDDKYKKTRYRSMIGVDGKLKHIGTFMDIKSAAKAYNEAAKTLRGKYARLNHGV